MKKKPLEFFGKKLKAEQQSALEILETGHSLCCHFSTNFGKSLVFQSYAAHTHKSVIVISPLKALSNNQVDISPLSAAKIDGTTSKKNREEIIGNFKTKYKILYTTPESFISNNLIDICSDVLIVFDECHKILEWGENFRKKFTEVFNLTKKLQVLLLSATLTEDDFLFFEEKILGVKFLENISERINLEEKLIIKNFIPTFENIKSQIIRDEKTLIFCRTKKSVEKISTRLTSSGFHASAYHSGLTKKGEREKLEQQFFNGEITILVATCAFELGVNVNDIRKVIFHDLPLSLSSYKQQMGRAGRDNLPAEIIIFYSSQVLDFWYSKFCTSVSAKKGYADLIKYFQELHNRQSE
jgi:ATP-dependent DNA helicase RecQ